MTIEAATIGMLLGEPTLVAIVGDRVWPMARPQGSVLPAIVVTRISGNPEYAADGEGGIESGRVQIDAYGVSYTEAHSVADAIRTAVSARADLDIGPDYVLWSEIIYERDAREGGAKQAEYVFRRQTDIDVWLRS